MFGGLLNDGQYLGRARDRCIHGATVLAFLSRSDGERTETARGFEMSYFRGRLNAAGITPEPEVMDWLDRMVDELDPSAGQMIEAAMHVGENIGDFSALYRAAVMISCGQRAAARRAQVPAKLDSLTVAALREVAQLRGWL